MMSSCRVTWPKMTSSTWCRIPRWGSGNRTRCQTCSFTLSVSMLCVTHSQWTAGRPQGANLQPSTWQNTHTHSWPSTGLEHTAFHLEEPKHTHTHTQRVNEQLAVHRVRTYSLHLAEHTHAHIHTHTAGRPQGANLQPSTWQNTHTHSWPSIGLELTAFHLEEPKHTHTQCRSSVNYNTVPHLKSQLLTLLSPSLITCSNMFWLFTSFSFNYFLFPFFCPIPFLFFVFVCIVSIIIVLRRLSQATVSVMISNLLICFCSFNLFCPILEKIILLKICIL